MKFHFLSSNNPEAKNTEKKLTELFGQNSVEDADYIIPIGGDGFHGKRWPDGFRGRRWAQGQIFPWCRVRFGI